MRSVLTAAALLAGLAGCKSGEIGSPASVSFVSSSQSLNVGETRVYAVTIAGGRSPTLASCSSTQGTVATASVSGVGCAVSGVAPGSADITATLSSGESASTRVTVLALQDALVDLNVSPTTIGVVVNETRTITAQATGVAAGAVVTYTYQSLSPTVASVDNNGVVRGVAAGTASITVTAQGSGAGLAPRSVSKTVSVTVAARQPGLTDLVVGLQPASQPLVPGDVRQVTATAVGPSATFAAVTYGASSNPAVLTVSSNGAVTAIGPGTVNVQVTATVGEVGTFSATTLTRPLTINVTAAPPAFTNFAFDPATPPAINIGTTQQLTASWRAATGATVGVTFNSDRTDIATVSATGLVNAIAPGSAVITATVTGSGPNLASVTESKSLTVTVNQRTPGLTSLPINPLSADLTVGDGFTVASAPQGPLAGQAVMTYQSEQPAIATVSNTGFVSAVGLGTTRIRVTATVPQSGIYAAASLTSFVTINVRQVTLTFGPSPSYIGYDQTAQLGTTVRDAQTGAVLTGYTPTYTSSDPLIATVSTTGVVRMVGIGAANITASLGGQSATALVTNVLASGSPITISGGLNSDVSFFIGILPGTTSVTVTLTGGTGNPDLFVYRTPFTATANCTGVTPTSNENCQLTVNGFPGPFEIRIRGTSAYTGVTLRATRTP